LMVDWNAKLKGIIKEKKYYSSKRGKIKLKQVV
jgi:hypothetical protein